jgi:hypothetical protein
MANISITTTLDSLHELISKMSNVYYISTPNQALSAITTFDMELPVLADSLTFDTGAPTVNRVKLTEGRTWKTGAQQGDADISMQVSSISGTVSDLFFESGGSKAPVTSGAIGGYKYSGKGYSLTPKKVTGALFMLSDDKTSAIYLPNVEMFASFNGSGGDDTTGYYNVAITPLKDSNNNEFYPLVGSVATEG